MQAPVLIELTGFSFAYGPKIVLHDFSLTVRQGGIHGIVGPNGTGKTTLFNAIFRHHDQSGIHVLPGYEKEFSYLQTDTYFYPYMTGLEYLRIVARHTDQNKLRVWQDMLDLPLSEYIHDYSTGMKKKIALLGVLLLDKKVLLLDEPTNGLDLDSCELVYLILEQLRTAGKTLLLSSHMLETLTRSCDRISLMQGAGNPETFEREAFPALQVAVRRGFKQKYGSQVAELLKER